MLPDKPNAWTSVAWSLQPGAPPPRSANVPHTAVE
jgi:hypothetical protein